MTGLLGMNPSWWRKICIPFCVSILPSFCSIYFILDIFFNWVFFSCTISSVVCNLLLSLSILFLISNFFSSKVLILSYSNKFCPFILRYYFPAVSQYCLLSFSILERVQHHFSSVSQSPLPYLPNIPSKNTTQSIVFKFLVSICCRS